MAKKTAPGWVLGLAQAGYWTFAAVYLHRHGVPVPGGGATYPYLAYLALNAFTFPLATLPLPVIFTALAARRGPTARTGRMLREVWTSGLAILPLVALLFQGLAEGRIGRLVPGGDRPLPYLVLEGIGFLLIADLAFYVTHRALHTRLLYRFHKAHHAHRAPTEAAAFLALSTVEVVFSGLVTVGLPMIVIPVHAPVAVACAGVVLATGLYIHEASLVDAPGLPLVNGPAHHQIHHAGARSNVNYGLIFTVFDRLLGTYAEPVRAAAAALDAAPPSG